jgi:polar amino acid transport system substrate-binding protein
LNSGNIDVIWNGYTITAARIEQVEFTKPYLNNEQVLVVANDSEYQTKADLAGKIVGAQVESAGLDALKSDAELSESVASIPEYDDYLMALLDLGSSRLDAVAIDKILIGLHHVSGARQI